MSARDAGAGQGLGPRRARARRGPSRSLSFALVALAVGLAALWTALPGLRHGAPELESVLEQAAGDPARRDAAARALAAEGDERLLELVTVLARGRLPGGAVLEGDARALVEEALERAPARRLIALLEREAARSEPAVRRAALALVGRRGEAGDVLALLAIASAGAPPGGEADALEAALSELIARRPDALDLLVGAWRGVPDAVALAIVRAAGRSGCGRAMAVVADALGAMPEHEGAVLAEVARLAPACDPEAAAAAARRVEESLGSGRLARPAADALGRLGDPGSIPLLVACLESEDQGLARTAHAALGRATGLGLRADPAPWRAWLAAEEAWLAERSEAVLDGLSDPDPAVAREALREILAHPLDRHRLAGEVGLLLERDEAALRAAGCAALGALGSKAGVEPLLGALEDEPAVAAAARAALARLTGLDRPAERAAWEEALRASRAPAGPGEGR